MSYWIYLEDEYGVVLPTIFPAHGGTYKVGTAECELNVTFNYSPFFYTIWNEKGLGHFHGMRGYQVSRIINAVLQMYPKDVPSTDYWNPTWGNARRVLITMQQWSEGHPHGIWRKSG